RHDPQRRRPQHLPRDQRARAVAGHRAWGTDHVHRCRGSAKVRRVGQLQPRVGAVEEKSEVDVCFASGRAVAALIRARKLSAREVMAAHLARISDRNPTLNAIVAKLDDDECVTLADEADRRLARGDDVGPLHGLPWAFKDLEDAVGFPNTAGSPIFKTRMPAEDSALVALLRRAGVIPIGKTNVPEFGMGSHTYNNVYGTTLNPWDTNKRVGGSSGGAGAAPASGMLPLADGSDLGGSLRNPANFNNIVALRPSSGRAPALVDDTSFGLGVKGPMARSVDD